MSRRRAELVRRIFASTIAANLRYVISLAELNSPFFGDVHHLGGAVQWCGGQALRSESRPPVSSDR